MKGSGRSGRLARLGIAAQVALTVLLAVAAVLMINWLAGRPGLRQRWDLTEVGKNTLGTATLGVLGRLPERVTIDVFYRPSPGPTSALEAEVMTNTFRLLMLMSTEAGSKLRVRTNDTTDKAQYDRRREELRLRGFENCLIVHQGEHRAVVRLRGDLATFDIGNPLPQSYKPARVVSFDAEEAIVQGILKVTQGDARPKLYFTWGHGERDVYDEQDNNQLGRLQTVLVDDGFDVGRWSRLEDGPIPEDCAALAIIGPSDPFADEELDEIERYVRDGGRLVVAPHPVAAQMDRSRVPELLERHGIEVSTGYVCQPKVDPTTGRVTFRSLENAAFHVAPANMSLHPIVEPIRMAGRSFVVSGCHQVKVAPGGQPPQGVAAPLFTSIVEAWIDTPVGGQQDHWPDTETESFGKFPLAVTSQWRPADAPIAEALSAQPESRLVAIGSADAFCNYWFEYNADFLRNLFNWLTDREYRVSVSPRDPDLRRIPDELRPRLSSLALWLLPGLCVVSGLVMAFVRSRGGPRRQAQ